MLVATLLVLLETSFSPPVRADCALKYLFHDMLRLRMPRQKLVQYTFVDRAKFTQYVFVDRTYIEYAARTIRPPVT